MAKRKVVLTGASGYIAQRMLEALEARYELVLLDARPRTTARSASPGASPTSPARCGQPGRIPLDWVRGVA